MRASAGCRTAKVKVAEPGQPESADVERVAAVRDALGPGGRIRVDANGAWDVDTAVRRTRELDRAAGGLEYVEQPCATVEELAAVRRQVDVPVAADESIRRAEDPLRVARLEAADVAVLKVQPIGGVAACLRVAEQIGLPVVVSSALETSVGIAAGLALAAALPELPYACGLATAGAAGRRRDLRCRRRSVDGMLPVVRPDPDLLDGGGRRRRDRRPLGRPAPPGRGAGRRGGPEVNPSTALATVVVDELVRAGCARRCCRRGRATRRCPSRCTRPTGPAGCGCTCASTSGPPASWPSGWPRRPGCRCRS